MLPLVWVHFPKTGSSFASLLAHFGCPDIPTSVRVTHPAVFHRHYPKEEWCNGSFEWFHAGHDPILVRELGGATPPERVVSMFRSPASRVVSGYFHSFHDCFPMQRKYNCTGYDSDCPAELWREPLPAQAQRLNEYAACVDECTARLLTGSMCGATKATPPDLRGVSVGIVQRLGFVGLVEEWPLSVCLFHLRFGGACLPVSFENLHPMESQHRDTRAGLAELLTADLGLEEAVYRAASDRFRRDVRGHGATAARCRRVCPGSAQHFPGD